MNGNVFVILLGIMLLAPAGVAIGPEDFWPFDPPLCCGSPFGTSYYDGFCEEPAVVCGLICYDYSPCYAYGDCFDDSDCVPVEGTTQLAFGYACDGTYGYGYGGETCPGDDDDKTPDRPMDVEVESTCEGNTVTVTSNDDPVMGVHVTVQDVDNGPIASDDTDANGEIGFGGCGMTVTVYASKTGFQTVHSYDSPNPVDLVSCEQCGEEPPPQCPGECGTEPGCEPCPPTEPQCPGECGTEPGCGPCPEGAVCEANICNTYELECEEDGFIGDVIVCTATVNGEPCVDCPVTVERPDGTSDAQNTDDNGQIEIPLELQGPYTATLAEGNSPSSSTESLLLPPPTPEQPPTEGGGDDGLGLLALFIILAGVIIAVIYVRRSSKKK